MTRQRTAPSADDARTSAFFWRFVPLTLVSFTVLSLLTDRTLEPYLSALASITTHGLALTGLEVARHGTVIEVYDFRVNVEGQCSALYETALLGAAILASPAPLARRLVGIGAGASALASLNVLRIGSLALIGALAPQWFTHAHLFVWQALVVAAVAACWLVWLAQARPAAPG